MTPAWQQPRRDGVATKPEPNVETALPPGRIVARPPEPLGTVDESRPERRAGQPVERELDKQLEPSRPSQIHPGHGPP